MSINPYKALLFDFDGVVAETLPFHLAAWRNTLLAYGADFDENVILQNEGRQVLDMAARILTNAGLKVDGRVIRQIVDQKNRLFRSSQKAKIYPELWDILLSAVERGYKTALVTGTVEENIHAVMPQDLYNMFNAIIDGNSVTQGKPAPDPYLMAADRLGISASDCIVIENAPMGIQSAHAAGMFCIAICTTLGREQLNKADVKLSNHQELQVFLDQHVFYE